MRFMSHVIRSFEDRLETSVSAVEPVCGGKFIHELIRLIQSIVYQRIPFSAKLKYAIINRMTLPQTKLRIKSVRIMVNGTILIDCKILMPQTLYC